MTKIAMSFEFEGSNAELIAQVANLLHEPAAIAKVAKPRKIRVITEEQKAAFRARMLAGRAAKAARGGKVESVKGEDGLEAHPHIDPVVARSLDKFVSKSMPIITKSKPSSRIPMPRTGHKVTAKRGAE